MKYHLHWRHHHPPAILLTDQGIERGGTTLDHALIVEESPDRSIATFVVSAPGVREMKPEFIGFSPSLVLLPRQGCSHPPISLQPRA